MHMKEVLVWKFSSADFLGLNRRETKMEATVVHVSGSWDFHESARYGNNLCVCTQVVEIR